MQLNNIKRNTKHKRSRSVGRGGKRGKTSGRGTKGQKARAGHKIRPEIRDTIMRLPKLRGYDFKSRFDASIPVNLSWINDKFSDGDTVSPETLAAKGLNFMHSGVKLPIKVLADGDLSKKVMVSGCLVSTTAKAKIEKAGGSIVS